MIIMLTNIDQDIADACARSIADNEVPTIETTDARLFAYLVVCLTTECDGHGISEPSNDALEFWGRTLDGDEWRVRARLRAE